MKMCAFCKTKKDFCFFHYHKLHKDGFANICKECRKKEGEIYRLNNTDKIKIRKSKFYFKNKPLIQQYKKIWQNNNRLRTNKKYNLRYKTDINYKLRCTLRGRLNDALKGNFKSGSSVRDLGCSMDFLKSYIESKFQAGMTWENWSLRGWHIDHIKPLSSFNLTNREEFLKACHYTNLQPLWAIDNLRKLNKI